MTLKEAHETGRKYKRPQHNDFGRYTDGYCCGIIPFNDAIADDWEVEPEVYTYTCGWSKQENEPIHPYFVKRDDAFNMDFEKFLGKRTKLTIEVLDNE